MFCWFDLLDFISINAYKRAHIISIESFLHMFISLPVSSLPCCLLGNVCHSVLPPLARPTLGRTQPSPDPKPLLPFHLLPGFTDVSTVSHCSCHSNTTSHLLYSPAFFMTNHNRSRATLSPNTQVCACATYTFPNILPLIQRAVTFLHSLLGWNWYLDIPHADLFLEQSVPVCEGWRWRELKLGESKPWGELMRQAGLADVFVLYVLIYWLLYWINVLGLYLCSTQNVMH